MRVEFLIGGFGVLVGVFATFFSRQTTDLIVAGNYLIASHRGAAVNAVQHPWTTRLIGVGFVVIGAALVVFSANEAPTPRGTPAEPWELILPIVAAVVLGAFGLGVLASRRRLTAFVARRLRANGGEIYEGDHAVRSARTIVLSFAVWIFVVAVLISAAGVILYFRA